MSDPPIRVLTLVNVTGPGGGAEEIVLRNASRIDTDRFQMAVGVIRDEVDDQYNFTQRAQDLGIDVHEFRQSGKLDRRVWEGLLGLVDSWRPHIVHAHCYKPVFYAWRLSRKRDVIPMATLHGWTGHTIRERYCYYPAERRLLRSFARIVAVSNELRDTYVRSGGRSDQVKVVLNGVDPQDFAPQPELREDARERLGIEPDEIALCGVGRVEPQKRFDILLESIALIRDDFPRMRLYICGTGSKDDEIRACIERLKLGDIVTMLGHRSDMKELYQGFDLFVQSSDYEGTPTVLVEAMACRLAVVATDVGGTTQLARHEQEALIVQRRDPQALAQAISRALSNKEETLRRVDTAQERVEKELSFARRMELLQDIYAEVVEASTASLAGSGNS